MFAPWKLFMFVEREIEASAEKPEIEPIILPASVTYDTFACRKEPSRA